MEPLYFLKYLSCVKVNNPILNTNSASESNNNSIIFRWITCVSKDIQNRVVKGFSLSIFKVTLMSLYSEQYLQDQLLI